MKIQAHDQHYSFDYIGWVNAVFDVYMSRNPHAGVNAQAWGLSTSVIGKFFRYQRVSLPTMLQIELGRDVKMINFVVKID